MSDLEALKAKLDAPAVVDFGDVQVGILMPMEIELKNSGNIALRVSKIDLPETFTAADYEFKLTQGAFSLAPNEVKKVTITFQPFKTTPDPVESYFRLNTDILDEAGNPTPFTIPVKGRGVTSGLLIEPNPIDFGTILVGSSKTLDVKITNGLSQPVDVITRIGSDGRAEITNQGGLGRFELVSPVKASGSLLSDREKLAPQDSITVQVKYVPDPAQEGREDRGRWVIANCDNPLCELPVQLIGKGTNAAVTCTPETIEFGDVNPEVTVTKNTRCKNNASESVTITGWRMLAGSAAEMTVRPYNGMPSNLAPGGEFEITTQFAPTLASVARGPLMGTVQINGRNPRANRDLNAVVIPVTGRAGGPDIEVTPNMINFGRIAIGTSSKRRVLIENAGYSDLTVDHTDVDLNGPFTVNRRGSIVVTRGSSQIIEVTFTPTADGMAMGEVTIVSDDADEREIHIPVQGIGVNLPPCAYTIAPEMVNFGIVQVLRGNTQGVRVSNLGATECLVNDVEMLAGSSANFRLVGGNETGLTIPAGGSRTFIIEYLPQREGVDQGTFSFYISNPMRSNPEIPVRGVGAGSTLLISPDEINFGKIGVNCSTRDRTITVYNTGASATTIQRIELPMGVSTEFRIDNLPTGIPMPPGAGMRLNPGQSFDFTVRYHANDLGLDTGFFHLWEAGRADPYVVPLYGEGATDPTNEDSYTQLENPAVDILFVVDNSCSMDQEQAALASNFSSFIQFADSQALDYRLAVVTTDTDGDTNGAPGCPMPLRAMRGPGMEQGACGYFADGDAAGRNTNMNWRIVSPDEQPSPSAAFSALVNQGVRGSGTERGLQAAYNALSSPLITGWNAGFIRPDAYLAIIFVSDEEDQSMGPVDFFVNYFLAIKGFRNTHLFSASAIVGDMGRGCSGASGDAEQGLRYIEVANRTGGIFQSICTSDWATSLQNLGLSVFGYKSRFFLSNQPIPGSVVVRVDDMEVPPRAPSGQVRWSYDPATNTVNFAPLAIPEPGSEIVIRYQAECL